MRAHYRFTASLVVLALAGCSVGPDYVKPAPVAPQADAYKELGDWKPAEPKAPAAGQPWWSVYNDPVLDGLEKQVVINNQNLKAQEAAYRQSVALIAEQRAGYFPSLGIDPSFSRSRTPGGTSSSGTASRARITNSVQLPLDATWVIDIWGQVRRQVENATATAQASGAQLAALTLSTQATLAQDYFQLRITDAQAQLLEDTAAAYARQLQIVQNKYNAGVSGKSDLMQAQTTLDNARSQLVALGVTRAQTEHAIAVLIGKAPADFSLVRVKTAFSVPVVPTGVPSQLLERNPTVAQAERQMAAANAEIGVALAGYYPQLTLSGSFGFSSNGFDTLLRAANTVWSFGPSVSWNIFQGGLTAAQVEAARAGYDQTVANYRQTVLTAFQGVEDNLAALKVLQNQAAVQAAAVGSANEAERLILNQYRAGTVDYTSVVTAQATALGDRQNLLNIMQSRLNASVLLIENLGGGWDASQMPQDVPGTALLPVADGLPVPPPGFPAAAETKDAR